MKNWKNLLLNILVAIATTITTFYGTYKVAIEPATPNFAFASDRIIDRDPQVWLVTYDYEVPARRGAFPGAEVERLTHTFTVESVLGSAPTQAWLDAEAQKRILAGAPNAQGIVLRGYSRELPVTYRARAATDIILWPTPMTGGGDPEDVEGLDEK